LPSQARPPSSQEIYCSRELQLSDGTAVFLRHWLQGSPRGRVLLLHGKGDHGGGFGPLAAELAAQGWEALAPDMRGFGSLLDRPLRPVPSGSRGNRQASLAPARAPADLVWVQCRGQLGYGMCACSPRPGARFDPYLPGLSYRPLFQPLYLGSFTGLGQGFAPVGPDRPLRTRAGDLPSGAAGSLGCRSLRVWCYPGPVYGGAGAQRPALP